MRFVIAAVGSRGDVQPFVALGLGLRRVGHDVTVATGTNFEPMVRECGLGFEPLGGDLKQRLSSPEGKALFKTRNPVSFARALKRTAAEMIGQMQDDTSRALRDADACVFSYLCGPVLDVSEKSGLPVFLGMLQPNLTTAEFPNPAVAARGLGGPLNRLSYDLFQLVMQLGFKDLGDGFRKRLGLPAAPWFRRLERRKVPCLGAYSPVLIPKPADWPAHSWVTGFWFLPSTDGWRPPEDLQRFLAAGPPPVCVGFGSMVEEDAERTTRLVEEAVRLAGQRAILLGGWSALGTGGGARGDVYCADALPHDWLLPRTAAVVHHGGAGTTGAALRAGVPSVVVPFFSDQPFFARRVHALGVGPEPIPRKALTAERLASALRAAVSDAEMRRRAAEVAAEVAVEDGVTRAVQLIQSRI